MNAKEWITRLSSLTQLPLYEQHPIFGDKSGALIGIRDGYLMALGLGKGDDGKASVRLLLRYGKGPGGEQLKQALKSAKGKFDSTKAEETSAVLVRTYSFGKPDPESIAPDLDGLLAALKMIAPAMAGKCEHCQRSESQVTLLNNVPGYHCSGCQAQVRQEMDAGAVAYKNLDTNLPRGFLYGAVAAIVGSIVWGGVAYLSNRIFLYGAIVIGLLVSKAVVKGVGKVTWPARVAIGVLTIASVALGDAFFYALSVARDMHVPFWAALRAVLSDLWAIETDSKGGLASILFGLIGAGIVMYGTRKPEFKARFESLGSPAPTLSQSVTGR